MTYIVYLRTNLVNGKQYVGQSKDFQQRERDWKCLKAKYSSLLLQEEREKYGIDNFETKILNEVDTQEEAWKLEQKYIKELETRFPNGYNKAYGGKTNKGGNEGCHNGKEFKKGNVPWNKGVKGIHLSLETEFKGLECVQLKDGKLVRCWWSIKEAAEKTEKCYTSSISRCCKGMTKTAGGFEWMYKSDYEKMLGLVS